MTKRHDDHSPSHGHRPRHCANLKSACSRSRTSLYLISTQLLLLSLARAAPLPSAQSPHPMPASTIIDPSAQKLNLTSTNSSLVSSPNTTPSNTDNSTVLEAYPTIDNTSDPASNSTQQFWLGNSNPDTFQIFYPGGSINPSESPEGNGTIRYLAQPPQVDQTSSTNATLEYNVFLPESFSFLGGGSLPGLSGGGNECCTSGGPE
jgi:hypothetical protein